MDEVEFALWVDEVEDALRDREDPAHLMIATGLTDSEAALATAELKRRGLPIKVVAYPTEDR